MRPLQAYIIPTPDDRHVIVLERGGKRIFRGSPARAEELGGVLLEMAATAKALQPARPRGRG